MRTIPTEDGLKTARGQAAFTATRYRDVHAPQPTAAKKRCTSRGLRQIASNVSNAPPQGDTAASLLPCGCPKPCRGAELCGFSPS